VRISCPDSDLQDRVEPLSQPRFGLFGLLSLPKISETGGRRYREFFTNEGAICRIVFTGRETTPEPTRSGTFLSFEAFPQPNRKISEGDFSWDGPSETDHLAPF
jgi:hypothetical protein